MTKNVVVPDAGEIQRQLKLLGLRLKEAREKKGYSLNYVTEVTRINLGVLQAIEDGKFEDGPGPVFIRGFIRTYGKLLGMNPQETQSIIDSLADIQKNGSTVKTPSKTLEVSAVEGWKILAGVGGALLLLGVVGGTFYLSTASNYSASTQVEEVEETPTPEPESTTDVAEEAPTPTSEMVAETQASPSEPPSSQVTPNPVQHPTPIIPVPVDSPEIPETTQVPETTPPSSPTTPALLDGQLLLSLKAKERLWIQIVTDDTRRQEIMLQAGEKFETKAKEKYQLTLGNSKNVEVLLNGRPLKVDTTNDLLANWLITKSTLSE